MCECCVVCIFKEKCIDFPNRCGSCSNNTGKKSYYQPYPYNPYPNPWYSNPNWWYNNFTCSSSYYQKQE